MNTPCTKIQEQLVDLLLGNLDESQMQTVHQHLNSCSVCQSYYEQHQNQEKELEQMAEKITNNLTEKQDKAIHAMQNLPDETKWNQIIHSKITKLSGVAAVVLLIAMFTIMNKTAPKTWAIEQTIDALKQIRTVETNCYIEGFGEFKAYIKRNGDDWASFQCLGEKADGKLFGLFKDNMYYWHFPGGHGIYQVDLSKQRIDGTGGKLYSEALKVAPVILPYAKTLFQTFKLLANEWEEVYQIDEKTGRKSVFVNCTYEPLSMSFKAVFDIETKLVVRAKAWENSSFSGQPSLEINEIKYNVEIADEQFDLEKRFGEPIIPYEEWMHPCSLLFEKGCLLKEKEPQKAIEVFEELYKKYPNDPQAPHALNMIGSIYREQKNYGKALEYFQIVIDEYPDPVWRVSNAYIYMGYCYKEMNQPAKAVESFEKGLEIIKTFDDINHKFVNELENTIKELKESL